MTLGGNIMNEAFEKIEIEKRDRIINCAFKEFSKYKFDKASTNNIVKEANISKGLLFYYFNNKEDLFEYLSEFCVNTILEEIKNNIDWNITDIFERVKQVVFLKIRITERYPYIFHFGKLLFDSESKDLIFKNRDLMELSSKIYSYNIDFTKFKEEVELKKAINIIRWTLEKYGEESSNRFKGIDKEIDYDALLEEINSYIEVLRIAFYKGEYL
ncbi:MAG: TetR/AcrR family transcriptional regulator [Firmicutes bacterium]|nr:TetR/AcrR family transcriptional regulator [Bacillota bacterium]